MTKKVRIENADMADYKVVVITQDLQDGVWVEVGRKRLDHPTAMTGDETYLTSTRRLVVEEVPANG